jgi:hypothetical protein
VCVYIYIERERGTCGSLVVPYCVHDHGYDGFRPFHKLLFITYYLLVNISMHYNRMHNLLYYGTGTNDNVLAIFVF